MGGRTWAGEQRLLLATLSCLSLHALAPHWVALTVALGEGKGRGALRKDAGSYLLTAEGKKRASERECAVWLCLLQAGTVH